jgi:uncharacterized protein YlxW (UPF0749 family)
MNPFEFVLIIIAMAFGMAFIMKKMEMAQEERRNRFERPDATTTQENRRLRDEVSELKQRLHVLERIATEKENSLSREIESLRDR